MRFRRVGGLDLTTGVLILGGACFVALSIVTAVVLLSPPQPASVESPPAAATVAIDATHPSESLPSDRVATVLNVDAGSGAGGVARPGDYVDVLGYLSRQMTAGDSTTRVLVQDVQVLAVDRSGSAVALTLAVPRDSALLLQESQALGARPLVTLRSASRSVDLPAAFTDSDLAKRFAGGQ